MKNMKDSHGCRLIVDCPDKRGVVAKVSASLSNLGATILEAHQHSDVASGYEVEQDEGCDFHGLERCDPA